MKTTSVQNKGASSEKSPFSVCSCMHAHTCVVLLRVCVVRDCCLHVAAKELGFAPILYAVLAAGLSMLDRYVKILHPFKPKHGCCSYLSECAANYAWDPENSPSVTSVLWDCFVSPSSCDHIMAGNRVASGLRPKSDSQRGHRFLQ